MPIFRILSLDPATKCGFAYYNGDVNLPFEKRITSGMWDMSVTRDESIGTKLLRFERELNVMLTYGIDLIVFEAARNAGPKMQGALVHQSQLQGVLKLWAEKAGIQFYEGYSPTTIKKFATGNGGAKKEMIVSAIQKIFGYPKVTDDNEADALALLHLAIEKYGDCEVFLSAIKQSDTEVKVIEDTDISVSKLVKKALESGVDIGVPMKKVKSKKKSVVVD